MAGQRRQAQHQHGREAQHAGQRDEGATQAEEAVANHQRQIDHVGPGQHLGYGQGLDEILGRHPAQALDQLTLSHGNHAAEGLQGQSREGPEKFRQRRRGDGRRADHRCTFRASGLTRLVGAPAMNARMLSNAALK